MPNAVPEQLIRKFSLISEQISQSALKVVLRNLATVVVNNIYGDVVEFGCYTGTTTLFLRRLLNELGQSTNRSLYAYDSFEGLPEKTAADSSAAGIEFQAGKLYVSKKQFLKEFQKAQLEPPITHKAWFNQLRDDQLPEQIAFAFLDGDFYESIMDSLRLVWPRLSSGAIIAIDDYDRETLPGVKRAVDDFFRSKPITVYHEHNIAILKP
jgi:O-methyltransferase